MRWFKHFTDNHRGRSIQTLIDRMGHAGLAYYLLLEACAEKLDKRPDRDLDETDCVFNFHPAVLRNILRMKSGSARQILGISQELGLFNFSESDNEVRIEMPMLLDLLDYDHKKTRERRVCVAPENRLENNRIYNRIYISPELKKSARSTSKETFSFSSTSEIKETIPKVFFENWQKLYDETYLNREMVEMINWLLANPKKNKRTIQGWTQFMSNWFKRSWSQYQSGIPTNKVSRFPDPPRINHPVYIEPAQEHPGKEEIPINEEFRQKLMLLTRNGLKTMEGG